ncbi:MAG: DegT/DnrJ/EryC1/StrS aminotransferase family protein [Acidobacteria bacterium]|nr:DegT/DnrJ/EryC1/StrS aminotransferase family protein [Acidobacteriota bacterium]
MSKNQVPFFRPYLDELELNEVLDTIHSGWLTSGAKVKRFEKEFAAAVGASHAVAVNSCTAALHLALEALGLKPGQAVLVPTMTFAATAAVVRYLGAIPILVDCDPLTTNMNLFDAALKLSQLRDGKLLEGLPGDTAVAGIMPVHVGGMMMDVRAIGSFASDHGLWVIEDAAHAFPSAWRPGPDEPWQRCGEGTAQVTCFSFYANKTITTGEGGMAVTEDIEIAERMRSMSLHGLSQDAWGRYSNAGSWDYKIVAPGYKYNLTDIAAAIGIHQLTKAEKMRQMREGVARYYREALADIEEIELPADDSNRIHSWHLFPIKLRLDRLTITRNEFMEKLKECGVGCSVHWRPLHLHPYYEETFGWRPEDLPAATSAWKRSISLPIFPGMKDEDVEHVARTVRSECARHTRLCAAQLA